MLTLFTGTKVRDRDKLIHELAIHVATNTVRQLAPESVNMPTPELRGYIRSHALSKARAAVRRAVAERHCLATEEPALTAAVLERAIHFVIRDLTAPPVVAAPTPHIAARHAA
jgi:hypothetical protein